MARSAHPETTAVVVTCGATPYLPRTLHGIFEQTHTPTRVVIVNVWKKGRNPGTGEDIQSLISEIGLDTKTRVRVLAAPDATNFGDAVRRGLALNAAAQQRADKLHETRTGEIPVIRGDTSPGWLWLLHDDSAPEPEALAHLLKAGELGPSIAVVGAKQRGWEHPERLLEVGIRATASARRFNPIEDDELDQGQYDHLDDVLAVGLAGALVRRDVWALTGGPDPALGPFGDGLELSRRIRFAGYRVVVEPMAIVYHARASYEGLRTNGHNSEGELTPDIARSFGARRKAQLYNWVVAVPSWKLPFLLLLILVLSPLRAIWRLVGKDMTRARAELAAGATVLSRPDLWGVARRRTRRTAVVSAGRLAVLEANSTEIRRARREHKRSEADVRRSRVAPSELEIRELAEINARRRTVAVFLTLGAIGVVALSLFGFFRVIALTGGALLPDSGDLGTIWERAHSPWIASGDGYPGPADPILSVLAVPLVLGMTLSAALKWLILMAIPAAALTAWAAAGTATRSTMLRTFAAIAWATGPLTLVAVGEGRAGALLSHIAAPLVLAYTARAMGLRRRDFVLPGISSVESVEFEPRHPSVGAAAVAALAFVVVAAGSPPLLVLGTALLVLTAVVSRARSRIWFIPIPALVLYGPWLQGVFESDTWRALLSTPGVPLPREAAPAWEILLGAPHALELDSPHRLLVLIPGAAVLALALITLFRGTGRARAVRVGIAVGIVGLALAVVAPNVTVAHTISGDPVQGWAGHGVTLMTLGFLMAGIAGSDGVRTLLAGRSFGPRHLGAFALTGVITLAALATPIVWVLTADHQMVIHEARNAITPALSQQLASGNGQARTLALVPEDHAVRAEVWRGDGPQMSETSMLVAARAVAASSDDDAAEALANVTASAVVGGAEGVAEGLAAHAIGVVLVPPTEDPALIAQREALIANLATVPGIVHVTNNEAGAVYRVIVEDPASRASDVARVQMFDGDQFLGSTTMNADVDASSAPVTVILAERADPDWGATLDGKELSPALLDGWQQAFTLPAAGGELAIEYAPRFHTWWLWAQALSIGAVAVLALPVRRRSEGSS